jgi:hypothetical protein
LLCIGCSGANAYFWQNAADEVGVVGSGTITDSKSSVIAHQTASTVGTITRASNVVTIVFAAPTAQPYKVGQKFALRGTAGATTGFDGVHTITAVATSGGNVTGISFAQTGANESGTPATGTLKGFLAVSLTTNGRPVKLDCYGGYFTTISTDGGYMQLAVYRDGFESSPANQIPPYNISYHAILPASTLTTTPSSSYVATPTSGGVANALLSIALSGSKTHSFPCSIFNVWDEEVAAGTYDYFMVMTAQGGSGTAAYCRSGAFMAWEA